MKARCLPGGLNYPMLEEYDFRNDMINPPLAIDLKPTVQHRPFQVRTAAKPSLPVVLTHVVEGCTSNAISLLQVQACIYEGRDP